MFFNEVPVRDALRVTKWLLASARTSSPVEYLTLVVIVAMPALIWKSNVLRRLVRRRW